jgi:hypothetical protein
MDGREDRIGEQDVVGGGFVRTTNASYLGVRMLSLAACLTPLRINLKPISSTSSSLAGAAAAITGLRALTCLAAVRRVEITLVGTMPKREPKT